MAGNLRQKKGETVSAGKVTSGARTLQACPVFLRPRRHWDVHHPPMEGMTLLPSARHRAMEHSVLDFVQGVRGGKRETGGSGAATFNHLDFTAKGFFLSRV